MKPLLALAVLAALASCSTSGTHDAEPSPSAAGSPSQSASLHASAHSSGLTLVSVLGDSHSSWPGSWFERSVADGSVPGAALGVFSSHPGRTSIALQAWVPEATSQGGVVLVQAGTNDLLLDGAPPARAAQGVEQLVGAVSARGAESVLVSVPPSATLGTATNELNALLKAWAAAHGVPWLDVTSAVTAADGTWRPGLSDDGIHANASGGALMAEAARGQLPRLLAAM
ncbi:SGNH/GDSL hydrolase family protein [Sinomonas sp. ASV486]|uniref:SGNH/GDSL hydrolase family protein n=1 Tax=Sinomonas sp. ASV486 TaxID=3051170 RepID=UPI0027DE9B83|nr:SGNH/GDSL hydrolase family protein [Sinomonas sp. ASV486]MDQ4488824.1 SGNH/GDSL hydrolase family protein [Sinomonas sp. ASV486]